MANRETDTRSPESECRDVRACSGPGALCAEAQADGVPCGQLGRHCEICGRAEPLAPDATPVTAEMDDAPVGT